MSYLPTYSSNPALTLSNHSAYELMSEQQRRKNHMQYGMTLCSQTLNNCSESNELFFTAITQINHGGPSVVSDPNQRRILAKLNLKAGRLSIVLSDYASALSLFKHGISYLEGDHWTGHYQISLDLFDAAAEAACVLNKDSEVTSYTEQLVANAKSFGDSLNCECLLLNPLCDVFFMLLGGKLLTTVQFLMKPIRSGCLCKISSAS